MFNKKQLLVRVVPVLMGLLCVIDHEMARADFIIDDFNGPTATQLTSASGPGGTTKSTVATHPGMTIGGFRTLVVNSGAEGLPGIPVTVTAGGGSGLGTYTSAVGTDPHASGIFRWAGAADAGFAETNIAPHGEQFIIFDLVVNTSNAIDGYWFKSEITGKMYHHGTAIAETGTMIVPLSSLYGVGPALETAMQLEVYGVSPGATFSIANVRTVVAVPGPVAVPEPAGIVLVSCAAAALVGFRLFRRRKELHAGERPSRGRRRE